ncbi:MAG: 50S ribosomal protein L9 [Dehalococcoidales bacterium]|nr:50S ribosomal protein L9 [Dehalococcoidales bacterium]
MKVIFIADVPNVARAGQTKEVANGYARNFLFPRKLAVLADSKAAATVESHLKKLAKQRAIEEAEMAELAKKLEGVAVTIKAKVGEKDKLYGSVTSADIAEALGKEIDREIDKKKIDLAEPIRQVGIYDITVKFTHDITARVVVTVMSDAEGAEIPVRAEKAVIPEEEMKEKKEKTEKKEKKAKKAKTPKEAKEKQPVSEEEEKAPEEIKEQQPAEIKQEEKPAKEKKAKAVKVEKPPEQKKEKKPKTKAKKSGKAEEEKKE